jgi:hypothetical protein
VLDLIKAGANVNEAQAGAHSTPLVHALKGDHMPVVHALLAAGARLDVGDANDPVLHMVAATCSPQALSFVLSRISQPTTAHANAALLLATGVKNCLHSTAITTSLLAAGASASAVGEDGHSALMRAAAARGSGAFQVLLLAGANLSTTSADGANAFVVALMERNEDALQLLRPHVTAAMANPRSDVGQPALVAVATEGDADSLLALISHGARLSDVGPDGMTVAHALAAACAAESLKKVIDFVKGGAGGTCAVGDEFIDSRKFSCAGEILSMVSGHEQQHGGRLPTLTSYSTLHHVLCAGMTPLHVVASLGQAEGGAGQSQGQEPALDANLKKVTQVPEFTCLSRQLANCDIFFHPCDRSC